MQSSRKKGPIDVRVSPNAFKNEASSNESALTKLSPSQPASSSVTQATELVEALKLDEEAYADYTGGEPSTDTPEKVNAGKKETPLRQENTSKSDSDMQRLSTILGLNSEGGPAGQFTMTDIVSRSEENKECDSDGSDDGLKSVPALETGIPATQPLVADGFTGTGELSQGHEELNEILTRLRSLRDLGTQSDADAWMTELVKTCHDPNMAIMLYKQVLGGSDTSLSWSLGILAEHCLSLYWGSGEPHYLDKALSFFEAARDALGLVDEANRTHNAWAIYSLEARAYFYRFGHFNQLNDIEKALSQWEIALAYIDDSDHENRAMILNSQRICLATRFGRLGAISDLDQAIQKQQRAIDMTPDGHEDKPGRLDTLGACLRERFKVLGEMSDLDQAMQIHQQVVNLTPDGHPDQPLWLSSLGYSFLERFRQLGQMDDLNQAFLKQQQAVNLMPDGYVRKPTLLNSLADTFLERFKRLGEIGDLDQAILIYLQAVDLTPEGHPDHPSRLGDLGDALTKRFERLAEMSDLDRAIPILRKAIDLTPDGDASKPFHLNSLGASLCIRYRCLGEISDLEQTIPLFQQAVALTPDKHAQKPGRLNNLGIALVERFKRLGGKEDLDQSILVQQQAVSLLPDRHTDKPPFLGNLAISFLKRFETLGEVGDLDEAILIQQQAVELMPDGHPNKPGSLLNLADALKARVAHNCTLDNVSALIFVLYSAANHPSGPPSHRFDAACRMASLVYPHTKPYQTVIDLIPQVVWLGRTIEQRYKDIDMLGGIVMEAVSAACAAEEYDLALEWIEQGHAIIWGQILQLRSPMDNLRVIHPDLAEGLHGIASALENVGTSITGPGGNALPPEEIAQERRRLAETWEDTLATVRSLPDFGDFLKPKSATALKHAAVDRMVILVNVSNQRSDALILEPGSASIAHVHLSTLSLKKVNGARDKLINSLHLSGVRVRDTNRATALKKQASLGVLPNILQMLWVDVAKPILDHLGYTTPQPIGNLPHVTWCLIGALAVLPLHAAGIYNGANNDEKLFNYVVSSYTPSLTSLIEGIEHTPTTTNTRSLLAITQQSTPKLSPLPATMREVDKVQTLMEQHNIRLMRMNGDNATVKSVSEAMNTHSWIHLACHGKQDATEPTKSAFSLHDGELELIDIMKKPLKHAELAYLSACQTASGHAELPNEAIHLAAGMFTAGFRTVVATLWSIGDQEAPIVAQEFYARLLTNPDGGAARALHGAVGVLREQVGEEKLLAWVPYIHIGC